MSFTVTITGPGTMAPTQENVARTLICSGVVLTFPGASCEFTQSDGQIFTFPAQSKPAPLPTYKSPITTGPLPQAIAALNAETAKSQALTDQLTAANAEIAMLNTPATVPQRAPTAASTN